LENNEVLEELARLRDQGIRIGLSLTGPGQSEALRKAMTVVFDGSPLFECVQIEQLTEYDKHHNLPNMTVVIFFGTLNCGSV
jgi:hypothetical protein